MDRFLGAPEAHDGRDVDDVSAALVFHDPGHLLGENPDPADIDVENLVPSLQGEIQSRGAPGGAGVVHQDVDAAALVQGFPDQPFDVFFLSEIAGEGIGADPVTRRQFLGRRLEILHFS